MRANSKIVICLAICCSTINALWIPPQDDPVRLNVTTHSNLCRSFTCGVPQSRSYRIRDILPPGTVSTSEAIIPPYTVIQRCDQWTGCCKEGRVCSPIPEKIYYVKADVIFSEVIKTSPTGQTRRTLNIQNHGGCACQNETFPRTVVPAPIVTIEEQ